MLLGSNKNNIIFMKRLVFTLILFMLFIIPIDAKAETKCIRGMYIHHSSFNSSSTSGYIEYGHLNNSTKPLDFGEALTCDVNGDGVFDEQEERFYYINNYYDTDELEFNEDYATLLYYKRGTKNLYNTPITTSIISNGEIIGYNLLSFYSQNLSYFPTSDDWSNVSLYKSVRHHLSQDEKKVVYDESTGKNCYLSPVDYTGHSARLLTLQEIKDYIDPEKISTLDIKTKKADEENYFTTDSTFLKEGAGLTIDGIVGYNSGFYYNSSISNRGFWLETYNIKNCPSSMKTAYVYEVVGNSTNGTFINSVNARGNSSNGGNNPYYKVAIDMPKADIDLIGRNNYLSSLSINDELKTDFVKYNNTYKTDVELNKVTSITATAEDSLATVSISDYSNLTVDNNTVDIMVTAESGEVRIYTIEFDVSVLLQNLEVQDYELNEPFDCFKTDYTLNVPSSVTRVKIIAKAKESTSSVSGAGTVSVTGTGLTQNIIVTSQNGDVKTYTIEITRELDSNLNIEEINVTNGSLTTDFNNETNEYTIKVEDDNVNLNVVPESTFTTVSGDGNITLDENTPVTVTLTAENGDTRVLTFHIRESIRVEKDSYLIDKGKTDTIVFTSNIASSDLKYEIEDTEVADLDGLTINAKDIGTTTIKISRISDPTIYKIITVGVEGGNLESILYSIYNKNEEQIISGIKTNTTVKDFKDNLLNPNEHLKVYNNEELLNDTDLVKTGFTVKLVVDGKELDSAIIIIIGDINQDGIINIEDEAMLFDYVNLNKELTTYQMYAADVSNDDLVDQNDITKLHDYLLLRNIDINKNKVIIDPNGGVYNESSEVQKIIENEETTEIGIPTKEGYTFNGWKLIGGGEITNNPPVDTINQTYTFGDYNGKLKATYIAPKNIKAYDVFGAENYTLSNNQIQVYNGNGIDGKISLDIELDKDDIIEYTYFVSMRTGGGFSINDGETILYNKSVSGPSSGSNSGDGSYTYEGSKKILKFYFSGNGGSFNIKIKSKNGATYLLKSNSVAVGYSTNGGTISEGGCTGITICSLRQVGETYGTLPTISKTGYTFNGWYQNSDFSGDKVTESTIVSKTTNHNLYAKFTINSYTLTINANGGTYSGTNPITQNYNTTATISKPTRSNYLFNGWSKSGAGSITNNESANQTFTFGAGNSTITANWMSNKKTVSGSNLNASSISGSTVSSSTCTSNPNAQLTLLPGESVTYYVVGSSGTMGGGGGSFSVDNDTKCSTSSSYFCSGTWKNSTSSNQTIKVGIGCSNATASFSLSNVKTRYGETYTLSK